MRICCTLSFACVGNLVCSCGRAKLQITVPARDELRLFWRKKKLWLFFAFAFYIHFDHSGIVTNQNLWFEWNESKKEWNPKWFGFTADKRFATLIFRPTNAIRPDRLASQIIMNRRQKKIEKERKQWEKSEFLCAKFITFLRFHNTNHITANMFLLLEIINKFH